MSLALGLGLGVSYGGGGGVTPLSIFGPSRLKLWLDVSDISTLYQDNTLATPVAALNDPIGGIKDKSGNGNNATQGTSGSRPLWKQDGNNQYNALFDGTDDSWATAAIDFSGSDKIAVFVAMRKLSDAASGMAVELSSSLASNNGSFALQAPGVSAATDFRWNSKGTAAITATYSNAAVAAPVTTVITGVGDISGPACTLRINGAQVAQSVSTQGTGNFGNYALNIGRRNGTTFPVNGQIYQLFIVSGAVTASEIAAAEAYMNSKSSAY